MILLVTGGTGSFGNAVVRRVLANSLFSEVRIFSRDECKQDAMRTALNDERVKFYIGDVRDASSLKAPMQGVDYVFHAAALKQVPSSEFFPLEAVKTNVLGAENVFDTAIAAGVKKVVALSTDKACYPINAMGQSKALMEKVMIAKSRTADETVLCGTRYGNVLGSRGSVVPHFIDQIRRRKKLTVTDPKMTRFMMTLNQAVDLVLYAFEQGQQGDMFVLKAPASTLHNIARVMNLLFDLPVSNVECIGTRHGEKLFETLVTSEEMAKAEDNDKYFRIPADSRGLDYGLYFNQGISKQVGAYTSHSTFSMGAESTMLMLRDLDCVKDALCAHLSR